MNEYACRSCGRIVDADVEPSPGEPTHCADCHVDTERMDELDRAIRDGLADGWGGAA